VQVQEQVQK
jgi:hypothetical protein